MKGAVGKKARMEYGEKKEHNMKNVRDAGRNKEVQDATGVMEVPEVEAVEKSTDQKE